MVIDGRIQVSTLTVAVIGLETLPETNIAPGKGDSYWKPPFLGAMLVLGGVIVLQIQCQ